MKKLLICLLAAVMIMGLTAFSASAEDGIVTVSSVDELVAAIAPGAVIRLEEGTYDLDQASTYGGRTGNPYVKWETVWDGWQLQIHDVSGLVIMGSGKETTVIRIKNVSSNVLDLVDCTDVVLQDFTAGHSEPTQACSGNVLHLYRSDNVDLMNLGLYGCGSIGVEASDSADLRITDCEIYECSSSGVFLYYCSRVNITGCSIHDLGMTENSPWEAYDILSLTGCSDVAMTDCTITGNTVGYLFNVSDSDPVRLKNVQITGNSVMYAMFQLGASRFILDGGVVFEENNHTRWYAEDWATGRIQTAEDSDGNEVIFEDPAPIHQSSEPVEVIPVENGEQTEVVVYTVDELLTAIGPNMRIVLAAEEYDLSTAAGYGSHTSPWYYWEDVFDGFQLVIVNVSNMTIVSGDGVPENHTLSAEPRYANVLTFRNCANVTVQDVTAGHTRVPGECSGGVLAFEYCANALAAGCNLYGCGTLGVDAQGTIGLQIANCRIYECSYGGIQCWSTSGLSIGGCDFWDLGGAPFQIYDCRDVTIDGVPVEGSYYGG